MCCGLFVELDTFELLIRQQEDRVGDVAASNGPKKSKLGVEPVTYIKCPVCSNIMNRLNYARISGVLIDFCREHGYWLDNGELEKIAQWVATGGLVKKYELEKEEAMARDSKQRFSEVMDKIQANSAGNPYGGMRYGGLRGGDSSLLDAVASLFDRINPFNK
jgi:Zn-finger nucleic acid-binding protein